jgi:hypothetical protein
VPELLKRKAAFLSNSAIMGIETLLRVVGGYLGALLAGH